MDSVGSGGLAAVSVGISPILLLIVLAIVIVGAIKLSKLLWVMFK
jgi:uncharacterized membrane protein YtjA (UPF0391 family)